MNALQTQSFPSPAKLETLTEMIQEAKEAAAAPDSPLRQTEVFYSDRLSALYEADIWLASEVNQLTGAYKLRGSFNRMRDLRNEETERGVVTASAGNHAQGVARCAHAIGVMASVYMPETTPPNKVRRTLETGKGFVRVVLAGETFDDSQALARRYQQQEGSTFIHPFDDDKVIAGQGTLGLEIVDELGDFDSLLCPVGGGGLLSGVGAAVRSRLPDVNLFGVEPAGAPSLKYAFQKGRPQSLKGKMDTFVDGASVKQIGKKPFNYLRELAVRPVTVSNEDTRRAVTGLWEEESTVPIRAELAGGLAVAGLRKVSREIRGRRVVCIVSGGNLSEERYYREVRWP